MSIQIAVCTNKNYLPGAFVTLGSLLDSNGGRDDFVLHVLDTGIGDAGRGALARFIATFPNARLRFHTVDTARFKGFTKHYEGDVSAYSRFVLGAVVDAPRCIYIDVDFLVLKDVAELWRRDTGSKIIWAVRSYRSYSGQPDSLDYDCPFLPPAEAAQHPYFCSGILLCDLDAWRAFGTEQKAFELAGRPGQNLKFHDQTTLNYILLGRIGELERDWSLFVNHFTLRDDVNYHYTNSKKPWGRRDFYAANILWHTYYNMRVRPFFRLRRPLKTRLYNFFWELRTRLFAFVLTDTYTNYLRKRGKPGILVDATRATLLAYRRHLLHGLDPQSKSVVATASSRWKK